MNAYLFFSLQAEAVSPRAAEEGNIYSFNTESRK